MSPPGSTPASFIRLRATACFFAKTARAFLAELPLRTTSGTDEQAKEAAAMGHPGTS
jgi:hypothetical protein